MSIIDELSREFSHLPGIGPRQAKRIVQFLLNDGGYLSDRLKGKLEKLRAEVKQCPDCFVFHSDFAKVCELCRDETRDESLLLVVAKDTDRDSIEKTGTYFGKYFILGANMRLAGEGREVVRLGELSEKLSKLIAQGALKEIILAFSLNTEGEHTARHIEQLVSPMLLGTQIKITFLGRGLSTGSELEYADKETIRQAVKNRS